MSEPSSASRLTEEQLFHWLRLIRSENVGPRTFRQLVNKFGGAQAALEALPALLARSAHGRMIRIAEPDDVRAEMERAKQLGVRFVSLGDADYPAPLRAIEAAPPLLALRGSAEILSRPCVAIVGSRNASAAGLTFAERLAQGLARENYVIVSGLARGVDLSAHRASLAAGTIAVLAGGHSRPYPSEHRPLIEEIIARGGAVVTEMPLEWEPRGRDFPRRNRIVSGLSRGVVVVEAARRSGSLITARFAMEQGREIFAVPGSPLDPRAEGTNDLLRQGATLCIGPDDVTRALAAGAGRQGDLFGEGDAPAEEPFWEEMDDLFSLQERTSAFAHDRAAPLALVSVAPEPAESASRNGEPATDDETTDTVDPVTRVTALLGPAPVAIDDLVRAAGLPAREVNAALLELDLAGRLVRHGSNLVSLA
ncbi:DNA-processing protein DprA [Methylosinus sporium]|uniref:DNA-protecting protein DprA n=1 Tax=Methylosinus sporium TaxID=428 RepID=A0A2U1SLR8_METSR|nr:DNA-processing protein DprA [Methylosinus sporium]PWB92562.1 DNA-protecting protein DprA [Methylosinus sporium]